MNKEIIIGGAAGLLAGAWYQAKMERLVPDMETDLLMNFTTMGGMGGAVIGFFVWYLFTRNLQTARK